MAIFTGSGVAIATPMKKNGEIDTSKVLYVTFEDMIYKYDEMIKTVMDFVDISPEHHVSPKTHFIPTKSINGTRLWERYPQYSDAVKIIEKELPDFLYNYCQYGKNL